MTKYTTKEQRLIRANNKMISELIDATERYVGIIGAAECTKALEYVAELFRPSDQEERVT